MAVRVDGRPIIPDIAGLTSHVEKSLNGREALTVRAALDILAHSGSGSPNVENILDYLRTLAELPGDVPIHDIEPAAVEAADRAVCGCIRSVLDVRLPDDRTPFHALAVWTRAVRRHAPIELFTTNYDLLIEEALEASGVPYFDGFVGSYRPTFDIEAVEEDPLPKRWARLWKLHGSINWQLTRSNQVVRAASPVDDGGTMIYPSHLKYMQSRRLPYLAMLDRLRSFLRQPGAILISIGFGYRDEHINEVIQQALRSNPTAAVLALMYSKASEYPEAIQLAGQTQNLSLVARDEAIIGTHRATWSPIDGNKATSDLGDFGPFGDLLWELVGLSVNENSESPTTTAGE